MKMTTENPRGENAMLEKTVGRRWGKRHLLYEKGQFPHREDSGLTVAEKKLQNRHGKP